LKLHDSGKSIGQRRIASAIFSRPFFLFLFFIVLSSFSFAAPPFQTSTWFTWSNGDGVITIVSPLNFYYEQNKNISLNFDVLNSSLSKLSNTTTNCTILITDSAGQTEQKQNLSYSSDNNVWYKLYSANTLGVHSFYVHCLSSQNVYGYASASFEVTKTGVENPIDESLFVYLAVALGVLLLLFGIMAEDKNLFTLSGFVFVLIGIYMAVNGFGEINTALTKGIAAIVLGLGLLLMIAANLDDIKDVFNSLG